MTEQGEEGEEGEGEGSGEKGEREERTDLSDGADRAEPSKTCEALQMTGGGVARAALRLQGRELDGGARHVGGESPTACNKVEKGAESG